MDTIYKFLMFTEVFIGTLILIVILSQKSNSDGLMPITNPFTSSSSGINPATKFTRILVLLFLLNSFSLAIVNNQKRKKTSIIEDIKKIEKLQETVVPTSDE